MEENKRFSWTDLFIKVILVVIFVLFTIWLLSLSNKGVSNSLDVLTNNIFSENIEKMKNVGKEYFTIERLPEKVGDVKTLTLEKMYEKKFLLELTDKNGNACSAKNSYVSIEKYENEYQMKVFLECGEESDYIIVTMGCYDYCDTDICEFDEDQITKAIEYQYKKTTGGKWSDWGKWSEWSQVSVTKENYREVETKVGTEEYSYDQTVTEIKYAELEATCPSGYEKTSNGTKCYKVNTTQEYVNPNSCPKTYNEYTLVNQQGFTCNYSKKVTTSYQEPITSPKTCYRQEVVMSCTTTCAPIIQNIPYTCGTTTTYITKYKTKTVPKTTETTCPTGYTATSDSKCSKTKTTTEYADKNYSCPIGYEKTSDGTKCFKEVSTTTTITDTREVTYYRYRVREYINGTTSYKWSKSKEDKTLLNAGYKLTGKTREVK